MEEIQKPSFLVCTQLCLIWQLSSSCDQNPSAAEPYRCLLPKHRRRLKTNIHSCLLNTQNKSHICSHAITDVLTISFISVTYQFFKPINRWLHQGCFAMPAFVLCLPGKLSILDSLIGYVGVLGEIVQSNQTSGFVMCVSCTCGRDVVNRHRDC